MVGMTNEDQLKPAVAVIAEYLGVPFDANSQFDVTYDRWNQIIRVVLSSQPMDQDIADSLAQDLNQVAVVDTTELDEEDIEEEPVDERLEAAQYRG